MQIAYHGGKCCGLKTIYKMGYNPDEKIPADSSFLKEAKYGVTNKDALGNSVSSNDTPYFGVTEKETYKERLVRFIDFLRVNRPSGLIEIALMEHPSDPNYYYSQRKWYPFLEELGFTMTTRFKNSNSGNWVTTWILILLNGKNAPLITDGAKGPETVESPDETDPYDEDDDEDCGCGSSSCCGTPGCCC
jgi:hypothetical protein